jgi:hypothetical protein
MFEMYDRFLLRMERLRGQWHRRDEIREDVSEGLKEVPGRWRDSDGGSKMTILVVVALCAGGIALTLF